MKIICGLDNRQQRQFLTSINMYACVHVKEHRDYYFYPIIAEFSVILSHCKPEINFFAQ